MTLGYVEQFINTRTGNTILNTASVKFFNDAKEIDLEISRLGLDDSGKFMYVHGVNNTFASSIEDASIISGVENNDYIPFCFIWPSKNWSLLDTIIGSGYDGDKQRNEESIAMISLFYTKLHAVGIAPMAIFSHSRGSYLASRFAERKISNSEEIIKSLAMAAPDVSKDIFYDLVTQIYKKSRILITLYIAENDKALVLSEYKNHTVNMQGVEGKEGFTNIEIIDVDSEGSLSDHDFHRRNENVGKDFREIIKGGQPAKKRSLAILVSEYENRYRLEKP